MARAGTLEPRPRLTLVGDAALLTAGVWAASTGVVAAVVPFVAPGTYDWTDASMWALVAGLVAGPLSAWLLHGRRMSWPATGGVMLGYVAGVGAMAALFLLFGAMAEAGRSAGWFPLRGQQAEEAVGLVLLSVGLAAFLVAAVWLDMGAASDMAAHPHARLRLDIARVAASAAFVVYCVVLLIQAFSEKGVNIGPVGEPPVKGPQTMLPLLYLLFAALWGVIAVACADLLARLAGRRAAGHAAPEV